MSPVEITQREMFDALTGLTNQVATMNAKLDYLCHNGRDHEKRIRSLEARLWPLPIVSAFLLVVGIGLTIWSVV